VTSGIGFESGFGAAVVAGAAGAGVVPAIARSRGGIVTVDAVVVGEAVGTDREGVALGTRCDCGCAGVLDGGGVGGGCVFVNDDVDDDDDGSGDRADGAAAGGTAGVGAGDAAGAGVDDVPIGSAAVVVGAVLALEGAVLAVEGASAIGGPRPSAGADDFVRSESRVTGSVK
jgi:hypothetical protein